MTVDTPPGSEPRRISISAPTFGPDVEALVLQVLRSGHLAQGPMVTRLEQMCAAMAGTRYAVAVSSGTAALEASLEALELQAGDEVITSPLTFGATLNAIIRTGATARFADVSDDFTIDPASVRSLVNSRTRVILPVHLYGLMADMTALEVLATGAGLAIVEDAAQAHGATENGRRAGGIGIGCFSFYATKNVTAGEGGVITTSRQSLAERVRLHRNQGMRVRYEYAMVGQNLRMTDLQAAVAIPQMQRLDDINRVRGRNAAALTSGIQAEGMDIVTPGVPRGRTHVWHQYTVLLPEGCCRNRVVTLLGSRGVGVGVYYPRLVWDHEPYRNSRHVLPDDTPHADAIRRRCLSLPVHPGLGDDDIASVIDGLASAVNESM